MLIHCNACTKSMDTQGALLFIPVINECGVHDQINLCIACDESFQEYDMFYSPAALEMAVYHSIPTPEGRTNARHLLATEARLILRAIQGYVPHPT